MHLPGSCECSPTALDGDPPKAGKSVEVFQDILVEDLDHLGACQAHYGADVSCTAPCSEPVQNKIRLTGEKVSRIHFSTTKDFFHAREMYLYQRTSVCVKNLQHLIGLINNVQQTQFD